MLGHFKICLRNPQDVYSEWPELEQELTVARDYPTTVGVRDLRIVFK